MEDFPELTDTGEWGWHDNCEPVKTGCSTRAQTATVSAAAEINPITTETKTQIHDAAHNPVTAVKVGSTVHDFVEVEGEANVPAPIGNVEVEWFTNGTCTGSPAATSGPIALVPGAGIISTVDATGFPQTVNSTGEYAFKANYLGDSRVPALSGRLRAVGRGEREDQDRTGRHERSR